MPCISENMPMRIISETMPMPIISENMLMRIFSENMQMPIISENMPMQWVAHCVPSLPSPPPPCLAPPWYLAPLQIVDRTSAVKIISTGGSGDQTLVYHLLHDDTVKPKLLLSRWSYQQNLWPVVTSESDCQLSLARFGRAMNAGSINRGYVKF